MGRVEGTFIQRTMPTPDGKCTPVAVRPKRGSHLLAASLSCNQSAINQE
jgi:hypothetical protein